MASADESAPAEASSGRGPLLDRAPEDAAKLADTLWRLDESILRRLSVQWEANRARRLGMRDVHVIKDSDDEHGYRLYVPLINTSTAPVPNKTDELGRRVIATLLVDEPKPDALPPNDSFADVDAAEFCTHVLEQELGPSGLNQRAVMEGALDLAYTFASGFTLTWTDPYGAGHQPEQILCHPLATLEAEAENGPPGAPPSADYVLKYVRPDGTLSESSAGARRQWRPKVCKDLLTSNHVRFLPRSATSIESAKGLVITRPMTFGEVRARWEMVDELSVEDQYAIVRWRPSHFKALLPTGQEPRLPRTGSEDTAPADEELCFIRMVYMVPTPTYPEGCEAVFAANRFRLAAQGWMLRYTDKDGKTHEETRLLPVAQYRWMPDHQRGNPYGIAGAEIVGPLDEIRGFISAGVLQAIYQALNPNIGFPIGTTIQPEQWGRRDGTPILFNGAVGTPWVEPPPLLPAYISEWMARVDGWAQTASGLDATAVAVNTPNIRSNEQAQTVIEQALVALAAVRHSIEDGFERDCMITLQEFKQHFTAPQMIRYLTDDGSYRYTEWTAADFSTVHDVRVRKGTFTMQTPDRRVAYIDQLLQTGSIDPTDAVRMKRDAIDWFTGQQEDRHYQRVKRQIAKWKEGPSESAQRAAEQVAAMPPTLDPATGQPAPVPNPLTEEASAIFAALPVDDEPAIAAIRHKELAMFMATTRYSTYPAEWQAGFLEAYERARHAAGITTIAEQQAAAQQQQAAAQQQQAAAQQTTEQQVAAQQQQDAELQARSDRKAQLEDARSSLALETAERKARVGSIMDGLRLQQLAARAPNANA